MKDKEYFVITAPGLLLCVEITPERQYEIDNEYMGNEGDYVYGELSEEFGFSVNNVDWAVVSESEMVYVGAKPLITKYKI